MAMWELLDETRTLRKARRPFALATVVRRERPASAHPGDQAVITLDGALRGWIGGSCAEPVVIGEALRTLQDGAPCLIRLGPPDSGIEVTAEGIRVYPMTCHSGGTLEIFVDPCIPVPQAMLVGHGPVVAALAGMAGAAGFEVVVCSLGVGADRFPLATQVLPMLEPSRIAPDAHSYVVVATHGQADEEALGAALGSAAPYVALVASTRRAAISKENLLAMNLTTEQVGRLHAPAGLDLGAVTPGEIAVTILAQMVQARRSASAGWTLPPAEPTEPSAPPVVDPVCGMTVDVGPNTPSTTHQGQTYYFCCSGCRRQFERNPEKFLTVGTPAGESA